jgi:hypothetical protein
MFWNEEKLKALEKEKTNALEMAAKAPKKGKKAKKASQRKGSLIMQ